MSKRKEKAQAAHRKKYEKMGFSSLEELTHFLDNDHVKQMIGKNYDHYRAYYFERYNRLVNGADKEKVKGSINWLGFFLPLCWVMYRRMYLHFFAFVAIFSVLSFFEVLYQFTTPNSTSAAIGAIYALMGKDFYLSYLVKHMENLRELNKEGQAEDYLRWRSGASIMFAVLALPIFFVCVVVASILASVLTGNPIPGME